MPSLSSWKSVLPWLGVVLFCLGFGSLLVYVISWGNAQDNRSNLAKAKEEKGEYKGVKTTEHTTFEDVYEGYLTRGRRISFRNVWLNLYQGGGAKLDVSVYSDNRSMGMRVVVKIDSSITHTTITVIPTLDAMLSEPAGFVDAERVVIYVPNKKDKDIWEQWLVRMEQRYLAFQKQLNTPIPKRVIPEPE